MGLLVVVSMSTVTTTTSVSWARGVVGGTTVRIGIGAGVKRTRHGLESVGESIDRLCSAHAIAGFARVEQSEYGCLKQIRQKGGRRCVLVPAITQNQLAPARRQKNEWGRK